MSMRRSRWLDASAPVQRWPDLLRPVCDGSGGAVVDGSSREADRDDAVRHDAVRHDAARDDASATSALETALTVAVRSRDGAAIAQGRRAASSARVRWPAESPRDADASGHRHIDAKR
jgi:hypothetical protein